MTASCARLSIRTAMATACTRPEDTFRLLDAGTGTIQPRLFMHGSGEPASARTSWPALISVWRPLARRAVERERPGMHPRPRQLSDGLALPLPANGRQTARTQKAAARRRRPDGMRRRLLVVRPLPTDKRRSSAPTRCTWGRKPRDNNSFANGDTTHLRTLQAFVSNPTSPGRHPRRDASDLKLSFWHIVDPGVLTTRSGRASASRCAPWSRCRLTRPDPSPARGRLGRGHGTPGARSVRPERLRPEPVPAASEFGSSTCVFTPTDNGHDTPRPARSARDDVLQLESLAQCEAAPAAQGR